MTPHRGPANCRIRGSGGCRRVYETAHRRSACEVLGQDDRTEHEEQEKRSIYVAGANQQREERSYERAFIGTLRGGHLSSHGGRGTNRVAPHPGSQRVTAKDVPRSPAASRRANSAAAVRAAPWPACTAKSVQAACRQRVGRPHHSGAAIGSPPALSTRAGSARYWLYLLPLDDLSKLNIHLGISVPRI